MRDRRPGSYARVVLAALLGLLGSLVGGCGGGETPPARNVVLIVVDTLRADQTSLHGYARETTPFLAEWARRDGQVFERARTTAPWTKPSVASMLTGLMPQEHGLTLHLQMLPVAGPNVAESFRERGFQTAAVQSNHLLAHEFGFDRGFDVYVDGEDSTLATHDRSTGSHVNQAALEWLDGKGERGRDPSRPFFLYVHHYEPHHNYLRDGSRWVSDYAGPLTGKETMDELYPHVAQMSSADVEFLRARYDAEILYQDELLRELVDGLRERELLADTAIVLTADHGEEFKEHGDLSHQYKLYDELLHVPLLVVRPGERHAGARIDDAVSLVDLPRTLLDLAGQYTAPFPGRSLLPRLEGVALPPLPIVAHGSTMPPGVSESREREMYLDGNLKLVRNQRPDSRELYDLARDPREQHDLASDRPQELERLERGLDEWKRASAQRVLGGLPDNIRMTPELERRLRALGYLR